MPTKNRRAEPAQGSKKVQSRHSRSVICSHKLICPTYSCSTLEIFWFQINSISSLIKFILRTCCILHGMAFRMCSFISGRFCCSIEAFFFAFCLPLNPRDWPRNVLNLHFSTKKVLFHYLLNSLKYLWNHCHMTHSCFLINERNWSRFWWVSPLSYVVCLEKPVKISVEIQ